MLLTTQKYIQVGLWIRVDFTWIRMRPLGNRTRPNFENQIQIRIQLYSKTLYRASPPQSVPATKRPLLQSVPCYKTSPSAKCPLLQSVPGTKHLVKIYFIVVPETFSMNSIHFCNNSKTFQLILLNIMQGTIFD